MTGGAAATRGGATSDGGEAGSTPRAGSRPLAQAAQQVSASGCFVWAAATPQGANPDLPAFGEAVRPLAQAARRGFRRRREPGAVATVPAVRSKSRLTALNAALNGAVSCEKVGIRSPPVSRLRVRCVCCKQADQADAEREAQCTHELLAICSNARPGVTPGRDDTTMIRKVAPSPVPCFTGGGSVSTAPDRPDSNWLTSVAPLHHKGNARQA